MGVGWRPCWLSGHFPHPLPASSSVANWSRMELSLKRSSDWQDLQLHLIHGSQNWLPLLPSPFSKLMTSFTSRSKQKSSGMNNHLSNPNLHWKHPLCLYISFLNNGRCTSLSQVSSPFVPISLLLSLFLQNTLAFSPGSFLSPCKPALVTSIFNKILCILTKIKIRYGYKHQKSED